MKLLTSNIISTITTITIFSLASLAFSAPLVTTGEYTIVPIKLDSGEVHTCVANWRNPQSCSVALVTGPKWATGTSGSFESAIFYYDNACNDLSPSQWHVPSDKLRADLGFGMQSPNRALIVGVFLTPGVTLDTLVSPPDGAPVTGINVNYGNNRASPADAPQPDPFLNPANKFPYLFRDKTIIDGNVWITLRMPFHCGT